MGGGGGGVKPGFFKFAKKKLQLKICWDFDTEANRDLQSTFERVFFL